MMTELTTLVSRLPVERIGWTLWHSIWQIAAVAAVYGFLSSFLIRSANARYLAGCVLLMMMAIVPVITYQTYRPAPAPHAAGEFATAPPTSDNRVIQYDEVGTASTEPSQTTRTPPAAVPADFPDAVQQSAQTIVTEEADSAAASDSGRFATAVAFLRRPIERLARATQPYSAQIVTCWMAGVLLLSMRLILGWRTVHCLGRRGRSELPDEIVRQFESLLQRSGIRRAVQISQSSLVTVPSVLGVIRPIILLPATAVTGLTSDQLEAVIAHELAHVRRLDFAVNCLQSVIESLLFFHPCVWWLSRCVRQEREHCCDDFALGIGPDRAHYVETLVAVEQLCQTSARPMVLTSNGGSLVRRVRRIAGADQGLDRANSGWAAAIALLLTLGALISTGGAWASQPSQASLFGPDGGQNNHDDANAASFGSKPARVEKAADQPGVEAPQTYEQWLGYADGTRVFLDVETRGVHRAPVAGGGSLTDRNDLNKEIWKWALREDLDFALEFETGVLGTLQALVRLDPPAAEVTGDSFDQFGVEAVSTALAQPATERPWTTRIPQTSRDVYAFRTHHGSIGLVQIADIDRDNRRVKIRYRLLARGLTSGPRAVVTQWIHAVRDRADISISWAITGPKVRSLGTLSGVSKSLWQRGRLHVQRVIGSKQTAMVITNAIKDNSGRERMGVFGVGLYDGRWLIDNGEFYPPESVETLLLGFSQHPGVVWDVRREDLIGHWDTGPFVIRHLHFQPDGTLTEEGEDQQRRGTWQLGGDQLTMTIEPGRPYTVQVSWLGPDSFRITNSEGSVGSFFRSKPASQQPAQPDQPIIDRNAREQALLDFTRIAFGGDESSPDDTDATKRIAAMQRRTIERIPTLVDDESELDKVALSEALQRLRKSGRELPLLQAVVVRLHEKQPLTGARLEVATRLINSLLK